MKVVYIERDNKKFKELVAGEEDFIALWKDNWDDYSNKTKFNTSCCISKREVNIGHIKILIEDEPTSFSCLDALIEIGWDGVFPIPSHNYISVPGEIEFYKQIEGNLDLEGAIEVAELLHDASYLVNIKENATALTLTKTSAFSDSLLRSGGANKAFVDGWKIFKDVGITIGDFLFSADLGEGRCARIYYHFNDPLLPSDINVLIGPNGIGKSQSLLKMVGNWLNDDAFDDGNYGFDKRPNVSQIVVVSYSPFELFPVDLAGFENSLDGNVYRYFGFRERQRKADKAKLGKVKVTRDRPKKNAVTSLIECAFDDLRYGGIKDWSRKVTTVHEVLSAAFDFDFPAIRIDKKIRLDDLFEHTDWLTFPPLEIGEERYIPINIENIAELDLAKLQEHCIDSDGVVFFKNDKPLQLSSGQRLFSYIVINILGAIRKNSLVIVDEPELFLHPTLEVAFVGMLKSLLSIFSSKAILATHSLVTVREIPRNCVHVFSEGDGNLFVNQPPFETFGGDMQRISSYVFGDKAVSKPYEEWIRMKLEEFQGDGSALIDALDEQINEEMIIQIHAMEREQW